MTMAKDMQTTTIAATAITMELHIPKELHEKLAMRAEKEFRTLNNEILWLVTQAMKLRELI
jgi:hypothetical protein